MAPPKAPTPFIPPEPPAEALMTWPEVETIGRQLEKELKAARMIHLAARRAREAEEFTVQAERRLAEIEQKIADATHVAEAKQRALLKDVEAAEAMLSTARDQHKAAMEQYDRDRARAEHDLGALKREMGDLERSRQRAVAAIEQDAAKRRQELEREHVARTAELDAQLVEARAEHRRVTEAIRAARAAVVGLPAGAD